MGKDKARDTTQIKAGREDTTTTTTRIGGARGKDLGQQDQRQEDQDPEISIVEVIKKTLVHDVRELAVQERGDRIITLAIQRREEEDQDTQRHAT